MGMLICNSSNRTVQKYLPLICYILFAMISVLQLSGGLSKFFTDFGYVFTNFLLCSLIESMEMPDVGVWG